MLPGAFRNVASLLLQGLFCKLADFDSVNVFLFLRPKVALTALLFLVSSAVFTYLISCLVDVDPRRLRRLDCSLDLISVFTFLLLKIW